MTVDQFFYATWQAQLDAWNALNGNELIVVAPVNGDFNGDGVVAASDYVVWRKNGSTHDSYEMWRDHFGEIIGGGSNATDAARFRYDSAGADSLRPRPDDRHDVHYLAVENAVGELNCPFQHSPLSER